MSSHNHIEVTLVDGTTLHDLAGLSQAIAQACEFDAQHQAGKSFTTFVTHDTQKNKLFFYQGAGGEDGYDGYSWRLRVYVEGKDIAQHLANHLDQGGFFLVDRPEGWPAKVYGCSERGKLTTLVHGNIA